MKNPIIRKVRVTIVKEIEVHLREELATEKSIEEWNKYLWKINGINDIARYAGEVAACDGAGCDYDGLLFMNTVDSTYPKPGDTQFKVLEEEIESEIIG